MEYDVNRSVDPVKHGPVKSGPAAPVTAAHGTVTPDGVDLKNSFLYSRIEVMRSATEGFSYEQLSNVAQSLASLNCERFAKAHPDFPAFNELMYIRGGIEEEGTPAYNNYAVYTNMFPDPVAAVTRAVDEMTKWCAAHPEDSLAQVTLGQFEELRGDRESVNRRLYQVLVNESKGVKDDDAMLLWAQLALICNFDGWITTNFGIPTPVKSDVKDSEETTRSTGTAGTAGAAITSSKLAGQIQALPKLRQIAFLAAAGSAVLQLLMLLRGISYVIPVIAAALLAYLIMKGNDLSEGSKLMAVPETLVAAMDVLSAIYILRWWRPSILFLLPVLLGVALAVVLWMTVLGRMKDRRTAGMLLLGLSAAEIVLVLLFGGRGSFLNFIAKLAALAFAFAYLVMAYLTYKDDLKGNG